MIGSLQKTSWGELVVVLTRQDKVFVTAMRTNLERRTSVLGSSGKRKAGP